MVGRRRKLHYGEHKASGQARTTIAGKTIYLGKFGTPESRERFEALEREWHLGNSIDGYLLTVDELAIRFDDWAEGYYRRPDGTPTGSAANARDAMRFVVKRFGKTRARDFGPLKLKTVRDDMIAAGLARTNINRHVHRIRLAWSWAVENELVPPEVLTALRAVKALQAGRSAAKESEPVQPVASSIVAATLSELPPIVAAMVRLQLLTGARPGEICAMRPCDVTQLAGKEDGLWLYRPAFHKNTHRGKDRRIYIGPQGQAVLRPYLDRDPEAFCFQPAEAEAQRHAKRRADRKTPLTPSQRARRPKGRKFRPRYDNKTYARAVSRACEAAEVDIWSPNQLRHSSATILGERFGREAAQLVLGHSDPRTTGIYDERAERDFATAARIMQEVG